MPLANSPTTVPVTVDDEKCIAHKGCTVCVDVCPLDVLRIHDETKKAYMKYDSFLELPMFDTNHVFSKEFNE